MYAFTLNYGNSKFLFTLNGEKYLAEYEYTEDHREGDLRLSASQLEQLGYLTYVCRCISLDRKDVWHVIKFNSAIGIPEYMELSSKEWDKHWNDWRAKFQPIDKNNVELPMFDFGF